MVAIEDLGAWVGLVGGTVGVAAGALAVRTAFGQLRLERRQAELERSTTVKIPGVEVAPPMPTRIDGYRCSGTPELISFRVFGHDPRPLDDFMVTMNGCGQTMWTLRWRTLGCDVRVLKAAYDFTLGDDVEHCIVASDGKAGLVTGNQCEQPVFSTSPSEPSNYLTDVTIELQRWVFAP